MHDKDKKKIGEHVVTLVDGLISEHMDKILEAYSTTDLALPVNVRFTLKGDDEKVSITSSLSYSLEKVLDHANGTINVRQNSFEFEQEEPGKAA